MFCLVFWGMIDHQPGGLWFLVSFSFYLIAVVCAHIFFYLCPSRSDLTSLLSPSIRILFVLGFHYSSSFLNRNVLLLNCRTIFLNLCRFFPPSRQITIRSSAVPVWFLVVPGGSSEHQSLCEPDIGRFCSSWGPAPPFHFWTRSVPP